MSRLGRFALGWFWVSIAMAVGAQKFAWRAYCITENRHLGDSYLTQSDASIVASSHTSDTGHSTRIFQQE